ncbi:uncharacterized protein LOC119337779 [Triticum dicoccoides]|uniref:uncharacterized protein LOC119337779 n=1 Tax=Triticum dicoccoides TaxID=85692 RepID=UPI0018912931|nr:uncharacterized protein LOC119337779 [Triticum dicoccoides]
MNSKIIDRIRKRRSEDDEDMMSFILPVLHRMRSRGPIERTQRHSSILYGKKRVDDILTGHVKNCLVAYRMEPRIFRALASYLRRENLISDKRIKSWPEIAKFQNKPFPLYDKLGDLYDGHIAEGNFNFTSTEVTEVSDGDLEVEREKTAFSFDLNQYGDDLHMYDDPRDAAPSDGPSDAAPSDGPRGAAPSDGSRDATQRGGAATSSNKHVKESKKGKKRDDPMVEVMSQYVEIKRKQAEEESALLVGAKNAQEFSISKCIAVLHKMESIRRDERATAYKVFKSVENREIFLNSAAEDEESAAVFLRSEMAELTQRT